MTDRKHASAAFWITVALVVVLVGYPLSFGPACWLVGWTGTDSGFGTVCRMYAPLMMGARCLGNGPAQLLWQYSLLGGEDAFRVAIGVTFESTRYDR